MSENAVAVKPADVPQEVWDGRIEGGNAFAPNISKSKPLVLDRVKPGDPAIKLGAVQAFAKLVELRAKGFFNAAMAGADRAIAGGIPVLDALELEAQALEEAAILVRARILRTQKEAALPMTGAA